MMKKFLLTIILIQIITTGIYWFWFEPSIEELFKMASASLSIALISFLGYKISGLEKSDKHKAQLLYSKNRDLLLITDVKELQGKLNNVGEPQASDQAERLINLVNDFQEVVNQKLEGSTISLSRYLDQANTVFNIVLVQLKDILAIRNSIKTTGNELTKSPNSNDVKCERLELHENQLKRINQILTNNTELLTALNKVSVEVANIQDIKAFETNSAMIRLNQLSKLAQSFSEA